MERHILIVAGGSGRRMGSSVPKQFLPLRQRPLLMHTIERFHSFDSSCTITLVLPEQHISLWRELTTSHLFSVPHKIVAGGEERFHSVKNGLDSLPAAGLVAIHDGVRPLVSHETIERCFAEAELSGAVIPVVAPPESVRMVTVRGSIPLDRSNIRLVQTPQVFSLAIVKKAYQCDYSPEFTDDATVVERAGFPVSLVEGNAENIKITTPAHLLYADAIMAAMEKGDDENEPRKYENETNI
ncbi:MAG: 2-C-methyl-D-erythritol 4-phosphate cytidylyltransferase [Bacteroidales bacterium]|nr:2-C-methyl-D-erythritol 4-phosphate cytidylyltransferase [Bacteroidales bacterium]